MKIKSIIGSFFKGALKAIPGANIVTEIGEQVKEDKPHSPEGKINYARLFGYGIALVIVIGVVFFDLDVQDAKVLLNKLSQLFIVD